MVKDIQLAYKPTEDGKGDIRPVLVYRKLVSTHSRAKWSDWKQVEMISNGELELVGNS